jgi:hypothetical protein
MPAAAMIARKRRRSRVMTVELDLSPRRSNNIDTRNAEDQSIGNNEQGTTTTASLVLPPPPAAAAAAEAALPMDEDAIETTVRAAYADAERVRAAERPTPRANHGAPLLGDMVVAQDCPGRGRGWVAAQNIPAGATVLCESPLAFAMDWEADALESEADNVDSAALILALTARLRSADGAKMLAALETLAPVPGDNHGQAGAKLPWSCKDSELARRVERALDLVPGVDASSRARLPQVVRANSMAITTNSEQLCYPESFASLGGTALYLLASMFNHSCRPNTSRYYVGTLAVFRTNRLVRKGEELCISYIESDILCEPARLRNLEMGERDFAVSDDDGYPDTYPVDVEPDVCRRINEDVQMALLELQPADRLRNVEAILEDPDTGPILIAADKKELALLSATACAQLGMFSAALEHWKHCVEFSSGQCPPFDEALVCHCVHAVLAAIGAGDDDAAREFARIAARAHNVAFGGGAEMLRCRYAAEVAKFGHGKRQSKFWSLFTTAKTNK